MTVAVMNPATSEARLAIAFSLVGHGHDRQLTELMQGLVRIA
jgi:hypothetical protein